MRTLLSATVLTVSDFSAEQVPHQNNWGIIIVCFLLLLFTLLIVPFRRKLMLMFKSLFSQRHYSMLLREGRVLEERIFPFTILFDLLTFSFGLLIIGERLYPQIVQKFSYMGTLGVLFLVLLLAYFLKFIFNHIYTALYDYDKERYYMNLYKFIFVTVAAMTLFPFLIVVQFTGVFSYLYAYISVFFIFLAFFLYDLMKINPRTINLLHFFIYFCTLEILPYVIMVKLITII